MDSLEKCPHCGSDAEIQSTNHYWPYQKPYWVRCRVCGAAVSLHSDEASAIAAWNRRATPDVPRVEVEWAEGCETASTRIGKFEGNIWYCDGWIAAIDSALYPETFWSQDGFPTADAAKAECTRRLALLLEATR